MTVNDIKFKTVKAKPPVHNFREAEEIAEGWLTWTWRETKNKLKKKGEEQGKPYKPGQEFLQMGVEKTEVKVAGKKVEVSLLAIELTEEGKACNVLYESLMRSQNIGKEFTVLQVDDELLVYNEEKKGLWMPRWSFHNLVPIKENYLLIDFKATRPSDQDIDSADLNQYKEYARIYNEAVGLGGKDSKKDGTIHELGELINAVNSTGEYYEICSEQSFNDYWNELDGDIKKGTEGFNYPTALDPDVDTHIDLKTAKNRLKDFIGTVINGLQKKQAEIAKIKGIIGNWLKEGNITDRGYNENVKKLKEVANHAVVKAYNDLKAKVMGGDSKYSEHRSKFEEESKKEVELPNIRGVRVKAEQEPTPIELEEIEEENFHVYAKLESGALSQDEAKIILDDKKAKKQKYKGTRNQRKTIAAIIERKKEVIELIEGLVRGEGPTQNIPQLRTQAISDIQAELDKPPQVVDSELGQYSDWKNRINKLDSETEINALKSTLKSEIEKARTKKESGAKLKKLIIRGETESNYENLETILKEIYKDFAETPAYQEDKTKVEGLEKRLLGLDASGNKYSQTVKNDLQAKLNELGLKEQDLTDETKQNLKNIRENTISDKQTLPNIKIKALEDIGKTDAKKKMETLQSEVQTALDSKDQSKIDAAKTKVNGFISKGVNNFYYKERETQAQALLTSLENYQQGSPSDNSGGFPWKIVVPIFLVAVVAGIILVMVWRKKSQAEDEE